MSDEQFSVRMRAADDDRHVSGAETIVTGDRAAETAETLVERALDHERGDPDRVTVTVERLATDPERVRALPVERVEVNDHERSRRVSKAVLADAGVSETAVERGFGVLEDETASRGAALLDCQSGDRCDPDTERGVRASRVGTTPDGEARLEAALKAEGLAASRLAEALVLATKVVRTPGVVAELCRSDNPDYTTGYVATADAYYRLPGLKEEGDPRGGRVFFLESGADAGRAVEFLRERPVVVDSVGEFRSVSPSALSRCSATNRSSSDPD